MSGKCIIVMGVCASGKTTIGERLAQRLHAKFIDGDDLHPKANILKMARGEPLNDVDRQPWLERIRDAAFSIEYKGEVGVIVCSALKKQYRDKIREGNQHVQFLYLDGSYELILSRMRDRQGHFMKEAMVNSQFATLEVPNNEDNVANVSIDAPIETVVDNAFEALMQLDKPQA